MSARWEYKVAYVAAWDRVSVEGRETRREEHERDSAFARRVLNEMGADGWELVSLQHTMRGGAYYIFKRPLEDGAEPDLSVVKREQREQQPQQPQQPQPPQPTGGDVVSL